MDNLKLIALTLLIPMGWVMAEAAAAYPDPGRQSDMSRDHAPQMGCIAPGPLPSLADMSTATDPNRPDAVAAQVAPVSHLQDQPSEPGTCRLNLNLIEID